MGSAQKFCEDRPSSSIYMLVDRHTDNRTDTWTARQTDHNTPLPYQGRLIITNCQSKICVLLRNFRWDDGDFKLRNLYSCKDVY